VFELFSQADNSVARTEGGLGIGLNIVRSLVELHGGEVSAHSGGLNLGSQFVVQLPVDHLESPTAEDETAERRESGGPPEGGRAASRVLVVDDSHDVLESTATLLELRGYQVQTADNGADALVVAEQFHPELVLLDIGMPGLDGYTVARSMRSKQDLQGVWLVAVSGYGTDSDRKRALEAGFDHHLTKPLDVTVLEALLVKH
jgi:CheY-like chemotaxis protein